MNAAINLVRERAAALVRSHAARLGMDEMAAGLLIRSIEKIKVPPEIQRDALIEALEAETRARRWEGDEDQQHRERMKACKERRKQWGNGDCPEKDGSCAECTHDMAEALETRASKRRRKWAGDVARLLREEPSDDD